MATVIRKITLNVPVYLQVSAEPGNTLKNITPSLQQVRSAGSSSLMPPVPLASIISPPRTYATYQGSLTTPPCSEGVTWLISGYSIPASSQQVSRPIAISNSK